jgi:uncharacterized protein (DUF1499 family)
MDTKGENLPRGRTSLTPRRPTPTCVSSQAGDPLRRVRPFEFEGAAAAAMSRLRAAIESMPGARVVEFGPRYLRAEFTSRWFRFVDDLELLVDDRQAVIHVRSESRFGWWDLGVNRRRVGDLRRRYGGRSGRRRPAS